MKSISNHIRAHVVGYAALFVALSGTAYAIDGPLAGQNQVGSADIINNEVQSADIRDANVTFSDLRSDAVTAGKIADGAVGGAAVADDSLTEDDIDEGAVPGLSDPRAFAMIWVDGAVVEPNAKNVAGSQVFKPSTTPTGDPLSGVYCFTLPFDVRHIQVTPRGNGRAPWFATATHDNDSAFCPGAEAAYVETFGPNGAPADIVFDVAFYD